MKKLLLGLLVLGAGMAGLGYWFFSPHGAKIDKEIFTFTQAEKGPVVETVSASGMLQPKNIVVIGSDVPGRVVKILAKVNDVVHEGQPLILLDGRMAKLNLEKAHAGLKTAGAFVEQARASEKAAQISLTYQDDLQNKVGLRSELEKARAELVAAKAGVQVAKAKYQEAQTAVKQADLGFEFTRINVPRNLSSEIDTESQKEFLILEKNVKIGQLVGPSFPSPLFTLAGNLSKMEIHAQVVEGDIGKIQIDQKALFTISSYVETDRKFLGVVREIRPLPTNVRGAVYYNVMVDTINEKYDSDEWRMRPGMTTSVDIILRKKEDAWKVPLSALNFQMEEAYQSEEAKQRINTWKARPDKNDWRPIWIWQALQQRVWPILVRLTNSEKDLTGIQDGVYHEVLEWDESVNPDDIESFRFINSAPPAEQKGFLERPAGLKLS